MTDLQTELKEQHRWRARPGVTVPAVFDQFLRQEFASPDEQRALAYQRLTRVLQWACNQVPHYAKTFAEYELSVEALSKLEDLTKLPMLTKLEVQQQGEHLRAQILPRGEKISGLSRSSGTSGRGITEVVHTQSSQTLSGFLKQRELRWFRYDIKRKLAWIRLPSQMPPDSNGKPLNTGETLRLPGWPMLARFFETGPFVCFAITNPIEEQLQWLEQEQPAYLMSYAESLEHLAFARTEPAPPSYLRGLLAISEQVTSGMRKKIERTFTTSLAENYGLNEVGVVASRCPEGGRFHVHTEACLVEIVDDDGLPVSPGKHGRLLVTTLSNPAMPLLRYDTGDLAVPSTGPCPCGRTLPSFERILGRYSRIAFLPEGTLTVAAAVREAIEALPETLIGPLREFQLQQFRTRDFELRVLSTKPLDSRFDTAVHAAYNQAMGTNDGKLSIVNVENIERAKGGKFRDFISEFEPELSDDSS